MQRIKWVPKSDPQTPAASRKEGYSTSLIRSGDSVSVPKTLHNQIVKLQSKHPKTALALDVLVIELSKLFPARVLKV